MSLAELVWYLENDTRSLANIAGIKKPIIIQRQKVDLALKWLEAEEHNALITISDQFYPPLLKQITDPPCVLFSKGNKALLLQPAVAIVGSRFASFSGLQVTKQLTEQLCKQQLMICSGMAAGIDGAAHNAALDVNGATVAVWGTGIETVYPRNHKNLATRIQQNGCIISEFWPDAPPLARNFPRRNRIISGIAMGTLVIEAKRKSGSLITARLAMEQGREVFAVPGSVLAEHSQGCHDLIKNGAKLTETAVDIIEELDAIYEGHLQELPKCTLVDDVTLSELPFSSLLASVSYEVTTLDEVVEHSGETIEFVLEQILELELQGWVASVPGGYIRLKRN